jgi:broad specificity phosphatase PhoE
MDDPDRKRLFSQHPHTNAPRHATRSVKFLFMRHGQTTYNTLGLCNDDPADPAHLTPLGEQQAQRAADRLRATPLDRILVSELPRTQQTAAIVNRVRNLPVVVHPALNDIRSGFNNRPVAEYFAATAADPLNLRVNGGESLLDHKRRVAGFIDWLKSQPDRAVLVIAHEETLRVFEAHFTGTPDAALRALHFPNCEVYERDL